MSLKVGALVAACAIVFSLVMSAAASPTWSHAGNLMVETGGPYTLGESNQLCLSDDCSSDVTHWSYNGTNAVLTLQGSTVFYASSSGAGSVVIGRDLVVASINRALRSSVGALELGGNHAPNAALGTDDASIADGLGSQFWLPEGHASDPCTSAGSSAVPDNAVFRNSTDNRMCWCNASGVDVQITDNSTACY